MLTLGALAARRDVLRHEANALSEQTVGEPGALGGPRLQMLAEQADARYVRLRDALPQGCPDDWQLVASSPLLAEYERKLRQVGPRLAPGLGEAQIEIVRQQIAAVCVDVTEDFDPQLIPAYTSDRNDDPVIHTALLADAAWLIADDTKHICTQPEGVTEYELQGTGRCIGALTFSRFLHQLCDIDLDHVDPGLLELAFRPLEVD